MTRVPSFIPTHIYHTGWRACDGRLRCYHRHRDQEEALACCGKLNSDETLVLFLSTKGVQPTAMIASIESTSSQRRRNRKRSKRSRLRIPGSTKPAKPIDTWAEVFTNTDKARGYIAPRLDGIDQGSSRQITQKQIEWTF